MFEEKIPTLFYVIIRMTARMYTEAGCHGDIAFMTKVSGRAILA